MSDLLDIEKTLQFIRDKADEYAVAKSQMEYLKEYRKTKKSQLIIEAERSGVKTVQSREAFAYAHKDYIELLDGLKVAMHDAEKLRLMIKAAELRIDVWRSQNANTRMERTAYGANH
ncbi:hypothetical protein [Aliikangiella coralliicola]|uniref:Uncharacterized protein n=1 Tax=Aliikangiella coralliicola TaxID=2592383 RepID=A0A545U041_9GAMM|nr:hypothetical protein [Aliikangiella coralliicola]TQV82838.1 hypothetical protein FLL46_24015 [Aliikangiella coralliicola]